MSDGGGNAAGGAGGGAAYDYLVSIGIDPQGVAGARDYLRQEIEEGLSNLTVTSFRVTTQAITDQQNGLRSQIEGYLNGTRGSLAPITINRLRLAPNVQITQGGQALQLDATPRLIQGWDAAIQTALSSKTFTVNLTPNMANLAQQLQQAGWTPPQGAGAVGGTTPSTTGPRPQPTPQGRMHPRQSTEKVYDEVTDPNTGKTKFVLRQINTTKWDKKSRNYQYKEKHISGNVIEDRINELIEDEELRRKFRKSMESIDAKKRAGGYASGPQGEVRYWNDVAKVMQKGFDDEITSLHRVGKAWDHVAKARDRASNFVKEERDLALALKHQQDFAALQVAEANRKIQNAMLPKEKRDNAKVDLDIAKKEAAIYRGMAAKAANGYTIYDDQGNTLDHGTLMNRLAFAENQVKLREKELDLHKERVQEVNQQKRKTETKRERLDDLYAKNAQGDSVTERLLSQGGYLPGKNQLEQEYKAAENMYKRFQKLVSEDVNAFTGPRAQDNFKKMTELALRLQRTREAWQNDSIKKGKSYNDVLKETERRVEAIRKEEQVIGQMYPGGKKGFFNKLAYVNANWERARHELGYQDKVVSAYRPHRMKDADYADAKARIGGMDPASDEAKDLKARMQLTDDYHDALKKKYQLQNEVGGRTSELRAHGRNRFSIGGLGGMFRIAAGVAVGNAVFQGVQLVGAGIEAAFTDIKGKEIIKTYANAAVRDLMAQGVSEGSARAQVGGGAPLDMDRLSVSMLKLSSDSGIAMNEVQQAVGLWVKQLKNVNEAIYMAKEQLRFQEVTGIDTEKAYRLYTATAYQFGRQVGDKVVPDWATAKMVADSSLVLGSRYGPNIYDTDKSGGGINNTQNAALQMEQFVAESGGTLMTTLGYDPRFTVALAAGGMTAMEQTGAQIQSSVGAIMERIASDKSIQFFEKFLGINVSRKGDFFQKVGTPENIEKLMQANPAEVGLRPQDFSAFLAILKAMPLVEQAFNDLGGAGMNLKDAMAKISAEAQKVYDDLMKQSESKQANRVKENLSNLNMIFWQGAMGGENFADGLYKLANVIEQASPLVFELGKLVGGLVQVFAGGVAMVGSALMMLTEVVTHFVGNTLQLVYSALHGLFNPSDFEHDWEVMKESFRRILSPSTSERFVKSDQLARDTVKMGWDFVKNGIATLGNKRNPYYEEGYKGKAPDGIDNPNPVSHYNDLQSKQALRDFDKESRRKLQIATKAFDTFMDRLKASSEEWEQAQERFRIQTGKSVHAVDMMTMAENRLNSVYRSRLISSEALARNEQMMFRVMDARRRQIEALLAEKAFQRGQEAYAKQEMTRKAPVTVFSKSTGYKILETHAFGGKELPFISDRQIEEQSKYKKYMDNGGYLPPAAINLSPKDRQALDQIAKEGRASDSGMVTYYETDLNGKTVRKTVPFDQAPLHVRMQHKARRAQATKATLPGTQVAPIPDTKITFTRIPGTQVSPLPAPTPPGQDGSGAPFVGITPEADLQQQWESSEESILATLEREAEQQRRQWEDYRSAMAKRRTEAFLRQQQIDKEVATLKAENMQAMQQLQQNRYDRKMSIWQWETQRFDLDIKLNPEYGDRRSMQLNLLKSKLGREANRVEPHAELYEQQITLLQDELQKETLKAAPVEAKWDNSYKRVKRMRDAYDLMVSHETVVDKEDGRNFTLEALLQKIEASRQGVGKFLKADWSAYDAKTFDKNRTMVVTRFIKNLLGDKNPELLGIFEERGVAEGLQTSDPLGAVDGVLQKLIADFDKYNSLTQESRENIDAIKYSLRELEAARELSPLFSQMDGLKSWLELEDRMMDLRRIELENTGRRVEGTDIGLSMTEKRGQHRDMMAQSALGFLDMKFAEMGWDLNYLNKDVAYPDKTKFQFQKDPSNPYMQWDRFVADASSNPKLRNLLIDGVETKEGGVIAKGFGSKELLDRFLQSIMDMLQTRAEGLGDINIRGREKGRKNDEYTRRWEEMQFGFSLPTMQDSFTRGTSYIQAESDVLSERLMDLWRTNKDTPSLMTPETRAELEQLPGELYARELELFRREIVMTLRESFQQGFEGLFIGMQQGDVARGFNGLVGGIQAAYQQAVATVLTKRYIEPHLNKIPGFEKLNMSPTDKATTEWLPKIHAAIVGEAAAVTAGAAGGGVAGVGGIVAAGIAGTSAGIPRLNEYGLPFNYVVEGGANGQVYVPGAGYMTMAEAKKHAKGKGPSKFDKAMGGIVKGLGYYSAGKGAWDAGAQGGPLQGAMAGAMTGSVFGPIGTAVGGILGLFGGLFGKKRKKKEEEDYDPLITPKDQLWSAPGWRPYSAFAGGRAVAGAPINLTGKLEVTINGSAVNKESAAVLGATLGKSIAESMGGNYRRERDLGQKGIS